MMKAIMKPRAAALAFAAPLLFAAPALADNGRANKGVTGSVTFQNGAGALTFDIGQNGLRSNVHHRHGSYGHRNYRHYGHDDYQQSNRQARRTAIQACRRAIRREANYIGFHDVDFERGRYAERIGPRVYRVTFNEVDFEGRLLDFERRVSCFVRRGDRVVDIQGIPVPGRYRHTISTSNDTGYPSLEIAAAPFKFDFIEGHAI
ncbi:MAG: hypothetical protein AAGA03_06340, partial [Planctomycetota bacterium]